MESLEDQLISQLAKKFDTQPKLSDSLAYVGVDSVGMAELTLEIEEAYGIKVAEDIFDVQTVQEMADYIRERQGSSDKA